VQLYTGAQINIGDLTPYLTFGFKVPAQSFLLSARLDVDRDDRKLECLQFFSTMTSRQNMPKENEEREKKVRE
jgi:hypothetical protein